MKAGYGFEKLGMVSAYLLVLVKTENH